MNRIALKSFFSACVIAVCGVGFCSDDVIAKEDLFSTGASIVPPEGRVRFVLDRSDAHYACGDDAVFTVTVLAEDMELPATNGVCRWRLDNFGGMIVAEGETNLADGNPFVVRGTLESPGFLRIRVNGDEKSVSGLYSAAYEPERISVGVEKPTDFDRFWDVSVARLEREVPLDPEMEKIEELSDAEISFYRVSFATFGGRRVYGTLCEPTDISKGPYPLLVEIPGAGPGPLESEYRTTNRICRLMMGVHTFRIPRTREERAREYEAQEAKYRAAHGPSSARAYPVGGLLESVEASHYYPVILGINRAVSWAALRPEVDRERVAYVGVSQGGGFGIYITALNPFIRRSFIGVPALSDLFGYHVNGRQSGWPEVNEFETDRDPDRLAKLEKNARYLDAAYFAERIRCPVRFSVGYIDESCAPHAVCATYNRVPSTDKILYHGIGGAHGSRNAPMDEIWRWCWAGTAPSP